MLCCRRGVLWCSTACVSALCSAEWINYVGRSSCTESYGTLLPCCRFTWSSSRLATCRVHGLSSRHPVSHRRKHAALLAHCASCALGRGHRHLALLLQPLQRDRGLRACLPSLHSAYPHTQRAPGVGSAAATHVGRNVLDKGIHHMLHWVPGRHRHIRCASAVLIGNWLRNPGTAHCKKCHAWIRPPDCHWVEGSLAI